MTAGLVLRTLAGLLALATGVALPLPAGSDEQPPSEVASPSGTVGERPAETSGDALELDLTGITFDAPDRYHLFAETRRAELQDHVLRLERQLYGPGFRGSPNLHLPNPLVASSLATFDIGPGGRPQFRLLLRERTWSDLDPWEKVGVTMQYASTLAAIGYFVAEALD